MNSIFAIPWLFFCLFQYQWPNNNHFAFTPQPSFKNNLKFFTENFAKKDIYQLSNMIKISKNYSQRKNRGEIYEKFAARFQTDLFLPKPTMDVILTTKNERKYEAISIPWGLNKFWLYTGTQLKKKCLMKKLAIINTTNRTNATFELCIAQPTLEFLILLEDKISSIQSPLLKNHILMKTFETYFDNIGLVKPYSSLERRCPNKNDVPIKAIQFPCMEYTINKKEPFMDSLKAVFLKVEDIHRVQYSKQQENIKIDSNCLSIDGESSVFIENNPSSSNKHTQSASIFGGVDDEILETPFIKKKEKATDERLSSVCTFGDDGKTPLIYAVAFKGKFLAMFLVRPELWKNSSVIITNPTTNYLKFPPY